MSSSGAMVDRMEAPVYEDIPSDFDYRPVPPLVPVSAAFVVLSLSAFVWELLVIVPMLGLVLSIFAWRQVATSQGAYSGRGIATASLIACPAVAIAALGLHAYTYATEVPEGFRRVSFATDISDKGFMFDEGTLEVHPDVLALTQEPIFLKGYMYPTGDTVGLQSFVLCKDSGDCCFGGQPKVTDMIYVEMEPGKEVNFRTGLVSVAGNLKASPTLDPTGLNPVYKLEGTYFSGAKSSY